MKWIVIEENPKPDNYIAVVVTDKPIRMKIERQAHSVFKNADMALERARELRKEYGVKTIKIFHYESSATP